MGLDRRDLDELAPGERGEVALSPLAFETWPPVEPGTPFDVYEGERRVGSGSLRSAPTAAAAEPQLRVALTNALEEWVIERFGERVTRRPQLEGGFDRPDLIAWFTDDDGKQHQLIAEIVARPPRPEDVYRLVAMMKHHAASLGVVVTLDPPGRAALNAIYEQGTVALAHDLWAPRIRVVTTRDLARGGVELLPAKRQPDALELLSV